MPEIKCVYLLGIMCSHYEELRSETTGQKTPHAGLLSCDFVYLEILEKRSPAKKLYY